MSIHIKKIDNFTSFCGLDTVTQNNEFYDYNVIFANNGAGKTSATRAFELLIKNNNHISKYQTINSTVKPKVSFLLKDGSILNIAENQPVLNHSLKLEIYNSDFLSNNAPFGGEFGLRKLDDNTIVLEGSAVGEETQEIERLNIQITKDKAREIKIIGDDNNPSELGEIKIKEADNNKKDKGIEDIRKAVTSTPLQISIDEIKLKDDELTDKSKFTYDEKELVSVQKQFDDLNDAIKKFDTLLEIKLPIFNLNSQRESIDTLFNFDIEKEAGEVSEKVKTHIIQVGEQFLKDGRKIIKDKNFEICPFCTQEITNDILSEYTNYFNDAVDKFDKLTAKTIKDLEIDRSTFSNEKVAILNGFDRFKPFLESTFDENKNNLSFIMENIHNKINELEKLISQKKGINGKEKYDSLIGEITTLFTEIKKIINLTNDILEDKKTQIANLASIKSELKRIKILKGKKDSFELQKAKHENLKEIEQLKIELAEVKRTIIDAEAQLQIIQSQRRPDVQIINAYLQALNLSKYSIDADYHITINASIIENENLKIVLSEGEKTTITFAYFLARLKLFYDKTTLKNLIIVIDDPISSLDESRIYNTSYLVAKINQEIAGEVVTDQSDKAQVFIFTHSHTFMTNIIRILGKNASYYQITRNCSTIEFDKKDKVAGYFDTFFLLLFKDIYQFANETNILDDYDKAINHGNKIRILLESFMKTNFISEFMEKEYKQQSSFDATTIKAITDKITQSNVHHVFSNSFFGDNDYVISDVNSIHPKIDKIIKGLHMDSHGSIVDFYSQHKTSLIEVQGFAKIAINIMMALNPNQICFYIEASK